MSREASEKEEGTPDIVTLRAVMNGDNKKAPSHPVGIRMSRDLAQGAVRHSVGGLTVSKPFSGYDVNDNPFSIDVGYAIALWIEE